VETEDLWGFPRSFFMDFTGDSSWIFLEFLAKFPGVSSEILYCKDSWKELKLLKRFEGTQNNFHLLESFIQVHAPLRSYHKTTKRLPQTSTPPKLTQNSLKL
jgi:hypothetical protein